MKLVLIVGNAAVGKMTVGQELMKRTKLRLFHNHMMIEPVIEIFGHYDGKVTKKLRQVIFEEFVQDTTQEGMIFTFMWAFDMQEDWDYVNSLVKLFKENNATIYCVELIASRDVRMARNNTENRLNNKASKRDIALSNARLLKDDETYRLVSLDGELPFENYMRIDNSQISATDTAEMIIKKFRL